MLALACAGLFAITAGAAPAGVTATPKVAPLSPTPGAYLTFSSATAFTIKPQQESWNGTLYWSTDTTFWSVFTASGATAAPDNGAGEYKLHLCGSGNTYITGSSTSSPWLITAGNPVDCSGNIETLLDHATVADGEHPTMASCCFAYLFRDCAALTSAPELAATNLVNNCYVGMFRNCTGLTNAPVLPATTLPGGCYQEMFRDCTSLVQAPALPAMTLPPSCYKGMFTNCTALATAPELPATTLGATCYQYMFAGCTSLTNAPTLQAATLAPGCYHSMFFGCTGLTQLPDLPATNLASFCYAFMFKDCMGVALHEEGTGPTWGIPSDAVEIMGWNTNMLAGTGGSFTGDPVIGRTYYYTASPPVSTAYLTFSSADAFTITPQEASWNGTLECSTNTTDWVAFTTAGAAAGVDGTGQHKLYFRGRNNTRIAENSSTRPWEITTEGKVACSGNIEALLDNTVVANGGHPTMDTYCFAGFFKNCQALTSAPLLPATNLTSSCYWGMFSGCTSLTNAPALPATTLASTCYRGMFWGCTSLTQAPALPATNLANSCYYYMFNGCTSLTSAPALPATTLSEKCYTAMFYDCAGLTAAPALPAMTLGSFCYDNMFRGCTSLKKPPALPATNLVDYCYQNMFEGCTSLTKLPAKNLALECYDSMFKNCTGIVLNTTGPGKLWRIPAGAVAATRWNTYMFTGTSGDFTGDPVIGTDYYLASAVPDAPLFATDGSALVFSDGTLSIKITNAESGIYYTLYTTTNLIEPSWERCGPSTYAMQDGNLIFENIGTTAPRRFFKVKASFTLPVW